MNFHPSPRLAWLVTGIGLSFILAAVPFSYLNRSASLPPDFALWPADLIQMLPPTAFLLVGGLVAARQPRNAYGWVMLANGFGMGSLLGFWTSYGIYAFHVASQPPPFANLAFVLPGVGWMMFACTLPLLMFLYPTGKPRSPRWKAISWILIILFLIGSSVNWTVDTSYGWFAVTNPFALTGNLRRIAEVVLYAAVIPVLLLVPISGIALILNARRSSGIEKQQYKWFAYATAILVTELIIDFFWEPPQPWEALKEALPLAFLAVAIGVAVLRYRLFDIDILIRRTLQYTLLTGLLALAYFGGVVVLEGILSPLTGSTNSPLVTVISTLAIAALFNPLRIRVQNFIDRRFYRKKYNAEQALAQFAATARDEVDIEMLTAALLGVVEETMQPEKISLWLKPSKNKSKLGGSNVS